jgi:AcrR family transcriptional regulator
MSDSPPAARGYSSKLRTRQKEQTGELILSSVAALLNRGGLAAVTIAAVAQQAEVTERTIYRHFATREDLLGAFWQWQLQQAAGENVTAPPTLEALLATIPRLFASLDCVSAWKKGSDSISVQAG